MTTTSTAAGPRHSLVTMPGVIALLVALISTALLAGTYYAYATSVMLAFHRLDDKTFVEVFNKINVVIVNPIFMLSFLGSVVFSIIAALFFFRADYRPILLWVIAAVVLNILSLAISGIFNIPLNNHLATADTATAPIDYAGLRHDFETPWVAWNVVRGLVNTAALGVLGWALVQYGRITAG
ncbi:anthrone oxygenase family protein [Nocardia sp. CDC160]|uniref:anthrone oxygenase family protein n=1 Tax=Nocardia sp. CDC160 TaxID=3112166 RepID=UPI002DB66B7D|nr:anthrone oxygenase family protein [Nocardia sp. CDC160]MEC3914857.1 anthrone oxygenase family protein [Nocardia sp. CDC160]